VDETTLLAFEDELTKIAKSKNVAYQLARIMNKRDRLVQARFKSNYKGPPKDEKLERAWEYGRHKERGRHQLARDMVAERQLPSVFDPGSSHYAKRVLPG
jgi:hypothetical protein